MQKREKVYVAMSGGVDSSVAAALLKKQGYDVVGVFMRGWTAPNMECNWGDEQRDAMRVAATLGIPFKTFDFSREYEQHVVSYLLREYQEGRTPNPDVMCNREMKFGLFLERALAEGADYIATGHYARIWKSEEGEHCLVAGKDKEKDQSYFLWTLTERELGKTFFPIGEYEKSAVRELARNFDLPVAEKKDSQGVCFVGELNMGEFLRMHIPKEPGEVVTTGGEVVGEHDGLAFYTIGQRHGLGIGGGTPYYVAGKDPKTRRLIVATTPTEGALQKVNIRLTNVNRITARTDKKLEVLARIRYRQELQKAKITFQANNTATVVFTDPQWAVAEGQSLVFYDLAGEIVLGGGVIEEK